MHILYFHQHFSTPKGAAGIRSYMMARQLVEAGHQVTMVCGSYGVGNTGLSSPFKKGRRSGIVDGIDVIEFQLAYANSVGLVARSWLFLRYAMAGIFMVLTRRYDLVFASTTPLTVGLPGIVARWIRRKPFVFEVRDLWPELPRAMGVIRNPLILGMLSVLEWASYHSAHRCVALSPGIADGIARRGIPRNRIAMVPNGCDMGIFKSGRVPAWRPEGLRDHDLMAVFSGTHGLANGLNAVLDAARVLIERGRDDIRLVLVGDGKIKKHLVERAEQEGLVNVLFHPPINKNALAGLMASADLGIQCLANVPAFYYGTSPNKFFDYIAAGLPVLNNYPGWIAEMITQHDCGFVVPPDDPSAFADALELAADKRATLERKGGNALRLASSEFDRQVLARRWVAWVVKGELL